MWELWKTPSGISQHFDRQLSAVEKAQDKVVCRFCFWGLGSSIMYMCSVMHTQIMLV